jgi:hypothetical protein
MPERSHKSGYGWPGDLSGPYAATTSNSRKLRALSPGSRPCLCARSMLAHAISFDASRAHRSTILNASTRSGEVYCHVIMLSIAVSLLARRSSGLIGAAEFAEPV